MNLVRRFFMMCAAVMLGLTVTLGFLVNRIYENNALEDAKGDLASLIQIQATHVFTEADFVSPSRETMSDDTLKHFVEFSNIPGAALVIAFSSDGAVIWSTDRELIGKRFPADDELPDALAGKVVTRIVKRELEEHPFQIDAKEVLEVYVPIRFGISGPVAGVIEVYQDMAPLRASILKTNLAVTGTLLVGFGVLYALLIGILRRGSRLIERSREELSLSKEKIETQRIELLKRIGASAIEGSSEEAILKEAAKDVCALLEIPRCSIRLFGEPDTLVEYCREGYPSSTTLFPEWPRPVDSEEIFRKGETIVVDDAGANPKFAGREEELARIRLGAYIGVPLLIHEELMGVVFVDRAEPRRWTEDEVRTAEAVARQIAVAVRHARLFAYQQDLTGRLVSLMDNVPGVVYRGLRDWSFVFAGANIVQLTGYAVKDFLSGAVKWRDLIHTDDVETVRARFRQAVNDRVKVLRVEYRILSRTGEVRWLADRRQLVYDPDGRFLHVDGLLLDITDRRRSDLTLRLTQFAVDRAGDAAYWVSPDGGLIYVNEQACRVLGYSRDELLSMTIHEVNPEFPPEAWAKHWEDLRNRKSYTMETRHRAKDGKVIPVEVTVNHVEFDGKEYNCVSARDISMRVQALERGRLLEAQLIQSQKMEAIGNLAGGIAHDFNNLLTGILGYANLLRVKAEPGSDVYRAVEVIQDSADRAAKLTAQLLGFARRGKNLAVPVNIHKTVDDVTGLLERTMDKSIRIRKSFAPVPLAIDGDPTQMQQLILNLAMNARDAMPMGGELTISTGVEDFDEACCAGRPGSTPGRYVRIDVADTGIGIPEAHLGKIFDPFFTTKDQGKGTGLGLSMVFGIVKNHGGYIEVESTVNVGSRFKVFIPLSYRVPDTDEKEPPPVDPGGGRGRILIIDDQESVRDVCRAMLENLGYTVSTASDGCEGVDHYRRHGKEIDLVIVDMVMPNLGGRDCFRQMKAINPRIRAVLSTGFSMDGAVQEIMREGISGFIQKPFRLEELSRVVAKSLEHDRRN